MLIKGSFYLSGFYALKEIHVVLRLYVDQNVFIYFLPAAYLGIPRWILKLLGRNIQNSQIKGRMRFS